MNIFDTHSKLMSFSYIYDIKVTKNLIFNENDDLISFLMSENITFENRQASIIIERDSLPYSYFHNINEFYNEINRNKLEKAVAVNNYSPSKQLLTMEGETVFLDGQQTTNYLFNNALAYFDAILFFKNCYDNAENEVFDFVDFYSRSKKVIIFSSLSEKRRLKLNFKLVGTIPLDVNVDYYSKFETYINIYNEERDHFHTFLKNSMISNIASSTENKFETFFYKIDKILYDAKLNLNVYLQGLSLEKIQTDYSEYKQAYFKNQNTILNKISNQITAFPFSIAAISFSLFKLSGNNFPLVLITSGLIGYVFYTSFLARLLMLDLQKLDKGINHDFINLASQKFFKDHQPELEYFISIKEDLLERIKKLKLGLFFFVSIVWLVSFGLTTYASMLVFKWQWADLNIYYYTFVPLGYIILYYLVYNYLIICNKKKYL